MVVFAGFRHFLFLAGTILMTTGSASATDWFVNVNSGSDSNDGRSQNTPFKTINQAVRSAGENADIVWLAPGVYGSSEGSTPYEDLQGNDCGDSRVVITKKSLTIKASGATSETVIQGNQSGNGIRPILVSFNATGVLVEGITLTGGKGFDGGGVYDDSGYAVFNKCVIVKNYAERCGGGSYAGEFTDCTFTGNSAGDNGGAVYYSSVTGGQITGNKAWGSGGGALGGDLSGVIIGANEALKNGGGACEATLVNCLIGGNIAENGGASSWGFLTNCTVVNNTALNVAAGCNEDTVKNCIVRNNTMVSGVVSNYSAGTFAFSCTTPKPDGAGNIESDPSFVLPASGDFHISESSPCAKAGSAAYSPSRDFSGQLRSTTTPSIGAYETGYAYGKGTVNLIVSGDSPTTAVLRGAKWRHALTNSWQTASGTILNVPAGIVPIVAAGAFGYNNNFATRIDLPNNGTVQSNLTYTKGTEYYVNGTTGNDSNAGTHAAPFQTVTKALAVCGSGSSVYVAPGTYAESEGRTAMVIGGTNYGYSRIVVTKPNLYIRSTGSTADTAIAGAWHIPNVIATGGDAARCISALPNSPVRMEGFSLIGGATASDGGAAMNVDLMNCTLTGNESAWYGGGAYYCSLTNCLVSGNKAGWSGGGLYGGTLMNSTVFANKALENGGGVFKSAVINSIVWNNVGSDGTSLSNYFGGTWAYTCTTPLPSANAGAGNITTTPLFTAANSGNIFPAIGSPVIDAGTTQGAPSMDLAGYPRVGNPDMGCYESGYLSPVGNVSVEMQVNGGITIEEILAAGAQWRLANSNTWHSNSETVSNVLVGEYMVEATPAFGFRAQGAQVKIESGKTAKVTVTYSRSYDWYVSVLTGSDSGDGSLNRPFKTVRQTLTVAQPGDTIWLDEGTYGDTEGFDEISDGNSSLGKSRIHVATPYITIRGRGAVDKVRIQGKFGSSGNSLGDDAIRCVSVAVGCPVVFNALTLTGGATPNSVGGGGAYLTGTQAELITCVVDNCFASYGGGVVGGNLYNCYLTVNTADTGGALHGASAESCTIYNNKADDEGAGAYLGSLNNCIISGNTSSGSGGGASNAKIFDCEVSNNTAALYGGGVYYCYNVESSTVKSNTALYGGGAYHGSLFACVISSNTANGGWGGGAYSAELWNCLLTDNSAANGAGSYFGILTNCTVSANKGTSGCGSYEDVVENSIVWGNTQSGSGIVTNYNNGIWIYSCTTPLPAGTGNISANPLFTSATDYSLQNTSPCIGKASSSAAPSTDILGRPRKNTPDMGAYETLSGSNSGSVRVVLSPAAAVTAGAMWSLDNGATWNASNFVAGNLTVGNYTVHFKPLGGWTQPAPLSVTVTQGTTTQLTATYTSNFDIALNFGNFTSGVVTPLAPGGKVDMVWNVSANQMTNSWFWCEAFASKTGGFDQVRFGSTVTNSYIQNGLQSLNQSIAPANQVLNTLPDGIYSIMPVVNRGSLPNSARISELNYVNNWDTVAGKRLVVRNMTWANVDLQMTEATFDVDSMDPTHVTVHGTVKNTGSAPLPAPGCWVEVFYGSLTAEQTLDPLGTIGAGFIIPSLEAGAEAPFTLDGYVREGVNKKALAAIVDSTDIVPETNEINNSKLWYNPSILPRPEQNGIDLEVTNVTVDPSQIAPNQVRPGDKLHYSVTVRNKGTAPLTKPVWIELFGSQDGGVSFVRGATITASGYLEAPALGSEKTYNLEQTINAIGDGMYTPVAVVNRMGVYGNPGDITPLDNRLPYGIGRISLKTPSNSGNVNIIWSAGPYFSQNGDAMTVTGEIKNVGTTASAAFWTEAFIGNIESGTGFYTRKSSLAEGVICTGLAPNATQNITIQGTVTSGKVVGVLTDSTDLIPELDETDNYSYSNLTQ